jgi:hypothetical protein
VFFCVSLLSDASPFAMVDILEEVDRLSLLFSSRPTLSWFSSIIMTYKLRENGTSPACSLFDSRQSP